MSSMHKKDTPAFLSCCEVSHEPKSSQQTAQAVWCLLGQAQGTNGSPAGWFGIKSSFASAKARSDRKTAVLNGCPGPAPGGVLHGRFTAVTADTGQVTALLWHFPLSPAGQCQEEHIQPWLSDTARERTNRV